MQVCISFMYGMQIPILFPIALFGIFNMYMNERLLLAYYYKQPPMYDMELHLEAILRIRLAPILCFLIGFWSLGNRQIFYNIANDLQYASVMMDPDHSNYFGDKWDATIPCIIFLALTIISQLDNLRCFKKLENKLLGMKEKTLEGLDLDEDLGTFWSNLSAFE